VSEKEALGVIWAIEKFRAFVEYGHFIIETDHQALTWLSRVKELSERLVRWFMSLQMYDFEVRYKPGDSPNIRGADALSRIPACMYLENDIKINRQSLIECQIQDPLLGLIIQYLGSSDPELKQGANPGLIKESGRCFVTEDGLLLRYVGTRGKALEDDSTYWRVHIPDSLQMKVMEIFHDDITSGHMGIRKTFHRLGQRVYWKNLRRDFAYYVNRCDKCQRAKLP